MKRKNMLYKATEFKNISIIELKEGTPTFTKDILEHITSSYPVVVSLNGRSHFVCVTKNHILLFAF